MMDAFDGVYLICLDVDEWGWGVSGTEFPSVDGIPVFYRLDASGRYTGDMIDGSAWGDDTPVNISAVMGPWFHR